MNLRQMRQRLYRMIGEDPTDPIYVSTTQANELINDAYIDMATLTGALEIRVNVRTTASVGEYTLPDSLSRAFRVAYDRYALAQTSQRELDEQDRTHRTRTGQPEAFTTDRMDERKIRLYPIPTVTAANFVFGSEYGLAIDMADADTFTYSAELGTIIDMSGADTYTFSSDLGIIIDIDVTDSAIDVWGKKYPTRLIDDNESAELPIYAQLGIVYSAAARALQARTEIKNLELASLYETYAQDYVRHLIRVANHRQPERVQKVGSADRIKSFRLTRDTAIPEP